jgi:hypothetical protein
VCPRSAHSARSSKSNPLSESIVVTHPFHPLFGELLPAGLDENGSASFAEDASAYLHADAKRRRLMTAVTDRRAPKCFLWSCG